MTTHSATPRRPRAGRVLTATLVAGSIATGLGVAPALAGPEQGGTGTSPATPEQGGTTPTTPSNPEQGGTTPAPAPAPAPEPTPPPEATYNPGPGSVPSPPQEAPYQAPPTTPNYDTTYNPAPPQPYTLPKPTPPVRPIAPPPKKIRVGNFVSDIPQGMSQRDATSVNEWSAYVESKLAQGLISVGVPEDEASRQAAATVIGVALGGTTGAIALGVPAAVTGAVGGAIIGGIGGAIIGSTLPLPVPGAQTLPGAAIGAGVGAAAGAAALGIPAAVVGAVGGGALGGIVAHTLGAGDPGAHPRQPSLPGQPAPHQQRPAPPKVAPPLPNPGGNQFELKVPAPQAQKAGLPAVDYQVNVHGDVHTSATVGDRTVSTGWSAGQAQAPYKALGAAAPQVAATARQLTKQGADHLQKIMPNVHVSWPQETPPAHTAPARR